MLLGSIIEEWLPAFQASGGRSKKQQEEGALDPISMSDGDGCWVHGCWTAGTRWIIESGCFLAVKSDRRTHKSRGVSGPVKILDK
jgi:hypothetical protein